MMTNLQLMRLVKALAFNANSESQDFDNMVFAHIINFEDYHVRHRFLAFWFNTIEEIIQCSQCP